MIVWQWTYRWGLFYHSIIEWQVCSHPISEPWLLARLIFQPAVVAASAGLTDAVLDADGVHLVLWKVDRHHLGLPVDVHVQEGLAVRRPLDPPGQLGQGAEHAGAAGMFHVNMTLQTQVVVVGLAHSIEVGLALGLPAIHQPLQVAGVVPIVVLPKDYKFIAGLGGLFNSTAITLGNILGRALWGIIHPDHTLRL